MRDGSVSVIDIAARRQVARIRVGKTPVQVGFTPDGKMAFVSLNGEGVAFNLALYLQVDRLRRPFQLDNKKFAPCLRIRGHLSPQKKINYSLTPIIANDRRKFLRLLFLRTQQA